MTNDPRRRAPAPPTGHPLDLSSAWRHDPATETRAQQQVAEQLVALEASLVRVHAELADADNDGSLDTLRADYRQRIEDVRAMLRGMDSPRGMPK
jgi:hypothetical protein